MDRVKAIKVLKPLIDSYVDYVNISMKEEDDDIVEALEMAVEALKADVPDTNVGDMISRQMAICALRNAENHAFNSYYQGLVKAHKIIADLPSVETEPKWISCKEKMPEEDLWTGASQQYSYGVLMYVIDYSDGDTIIDFGHTIDGKWYSDTADTYVENYSCKVVAWMSPPRYKENE